MFFPLAPESQLRVLVYCEHLEAKKQKGGQRFQSLIFILCQNRISDWSNIVFWLMCFRKLVTDPDCESLLVDDSAGENTAEIIFL